jgi:hypothetical protein
VEALLVWLEGSVLGLTMRSSGVWTYGVVNLVHILSVATLFGSLLVLDLRLLGVWREVRSRRSRAHRAARGARVRRRGGERRLPDHDQRHGVSRQSVRADQVAAIALGILNVLALQLLPAWKARAAAVPPPHARAQLAIAGGLSLTCWLAAVTAGRMIGYW